jgi:hypothetical protein
MRPQVLERLPQPDVYFRVERTHLAPRLGGQRLSQIAFKSERKASVVGSVELHARDASLASERTEGTTQRRLRLGKIDEFC